MYMHIHILSSAPLWYVLKLKYGFLNFFFKILVSACPFLLTKKRGRGGGGKEGRGEKGGREGCGGRRGSRRRRITLQGILPP
jgi:hypothetical protein